MSKPRTLNYSNAEYVVLTKAWLDVKQDPIVGNNQSKAQFWQRICDKYNADKPTSKPTRNVRSFECRMQLIYKDCKKFHGCVKQVELLHISGANEQHNYEQALEMLSRQKGYTDGFKFSHVWSTIKGHLEAQATTDGGRVSSQVEENPTESPNSSTPSLSSFTINLSDDNASGGGSPSHRLEGINKSKLKRKQAEEISNFMQSVKEENAQLRGYLENSAEERGVALKLQQDKVEALKEKNQIKKEALRFRQQVRDDTILNTDPDSYADPERRAALRVEQQLIMQKRREAFVATSNNTMFGMFGQFPDLGGSGSGLGPF